MSVYLSPSIFSPLYLTYASLSLYIPSLTDIAQSVQLFISNVSWPMKTRSALSFFFISLWLYTRLSVFLSLSIFIFLSLILFLYSYFYMLSLWPTPFLIDLHVEQFFLTRAHSQFHSPFEVFPDFVAGLTQCECAGKCEIEIYLVSHVVGRRH